ncbi:MAG: 4-hydroxybenzoyl-CoA reductase subunit beta [Hyphomicrobiales bacterium]|nr:4-hydroxybenzoyl-CoA reductase subunit beta [Hyphomicrobiales bacterium]
MTGARLDFQVIRPLDVASAIKAAAEHAGSRYLAGGTDLLVNVRHGLDRPACLIDLGGIDGLSRIEVTDEGLCIGAGVTLAELARTPAVAARYRALAEAAAAVAGPGHRAMATVGGNLCLDTRCIYYNQSEWWRAANGYCLKHRGEVCHVAPQGQRCHAAYCGDIAPALMVLGATVEIAGTHGQRRIPSVDLYADDGRAHLTLAPGELLLSVHLPPASVPSRYAKARIRGAIDFPLAGAAVALDLSTDRRVNGLKVALTGTNPRPILLERTEMFRGCAVDEALLKQLANLVQKQVEPMRTTTASAHYRRLAAAGLVRRLVNELSTPTAGAP